MVIVVVISTGRAHSSVTAACALARLASCSPALPARCTAFLRPRAPGPASVMASRLLSICACLLCFGPNWQSDWQPPRGALAT
jgi:hypothetical protein